MEAVIEAPDYSEANIKKAIRISCFLCRKYLKRVGRVDDPLVDAESAAHDAIMQLMGVGKDLSLAPRKSIFCVKDLIRKTYGRQGTHYRTRPKFLSFDAVKVLSEMKTKCVWDPQAKTVPHKEELKELLDQAQLYPDQRWVLEALYIEDLMQKQVAVRIDGSKGYICMLSNEALREVGKAVQAQDNSYSWVNLDGKATAARWRKGCVRRIRAPRKKQQICNPTDVP